MTYMRSSKLNNNRWRRSLAILLLTTGLLLGACQLTETQPMIELSLDRPEYNSAEVTIEDGRALIDVTDRQGINGLNARLVDGDWPAEIVVRLPLRGLEQLWIHYGDLAISTGVSSTGAPVPLTITVVDEAGNTQSASPSADIYYPDIRAVTPDGPTAVGPLATGDRPAIPLPEGSAFEITLPPDFFREAHDSFSMQWIDFYR